MAPDYAELEKRFTYHKPRERQPQKYEALRAGCLALAKLIVDQTPEGREQDAALMHLDEVDMFANAAIARRDVT